MDKFFVANLKNVIFCESNNYNFDSKDIPMDKIKEIILRIDSEEFLSFIKQRLDPYLTDEFIAQERIPIPDSNPHLLIPSNLPSNQKANYSSEKFYASAMASKEKEGVSGTFIHDGYIAGGSIFNLTNEFFTLTPAVINDVDYFYYDFNEVKDLSELEQVFYDGMNCSYKIVKTFNKGVINFIQFQSYRECPWAHLLNSFDLNCTMMGFHPKTNKIIINFDALLFLVNKEIRLNKAVAFDLNFDEKELEATSLHFSFSSILRAKRKARELNAFFPFNDYMKKFIWENNGVLVNKKALITNSRKEASSKTEEGCVVQTPVVFLSLKHYEEIKKDPNLLSPYFTFENGHLKYLDPFVPAFNFLKTFTNNFQDIEELKNFIIYENYFRIYEPKFPMKDLKNIIYERFCLLKKNNLITFATKNCFKENLSSTKIPLLAKFVSEHPNYKKIIDILILSYSWSLNDVCSLILRIKPHEEIIGILDSFNLKFSPILPEQYSNLLSLISEKKINDFVISKIIDCLFKIYEENREKDYLKDKESLDCFNLYIRELTLSSELEDESKKMSHCVRGYAYKVKNGDCRIFSIRTGNEFSTLEIIPSIVKNKRGRIISFNYKIAQHKSYGNRVPCSRNTKLAILFLNFLNLKYSFNFSKTPKKQIYFDDAGDNF